MDTFLESANLSKHQAKLEEEGYEGLDDLRDADDKDLAACGLKTAEVKRLRRTLSATLDEPPPPAEKPGGSVRNLPTAMYARSSSVASFASLHFVEASASKTPKAPLSPMISGVNARPRRVSMPVSDNSLPFSSAPVPGVLHAALRVHSTGRPDTVV